MCCGKNRQTMSKAPGLRRNPPPAGFAGTMQAKPKTAVPRLVSTVPGRPLRFEYMGRSAVTVISPVTGKRYRFEHGGARMEADPRDRSLLAAVPGLRQILS
jgi:hypothetical protein